MAQNWDDSGLNGASQGEFFVIFHFVPGEDKILQSREETLVVVVDVELVKVQRITVGEGFEGKKDDAVKAGLKNVGAS